MIIKLVILLALAAILFALWPRFVGRVVSWCARPFIRRIRGPD